MACAHPAVLSRGSSPQVLLSIARTHLCCCMGKSLSVWEERRRGDTPLWAVTFFVFCYAHACHAHRMAFIYRLGVNLPNLQASGALRFVHMPDGFCNPPKPARIFALALGWNMAGFGHLHVMVVGKGQRLGNGKRMPTLPALFSDQKVGFLAVNISMPWRAVLGCVLAWRAYFSPGRTSFTCLHVWQALLCLC